MTMETPYRKAWTAFMLSAEGKRAVQAAARTPEDRRYAENRVRVAFDAGYNAARDHYTDKGD